MKTIQISSNHFPSRKQVESMAQAEGISPSELWSNKKLVCSYLITFSIANVGRQLEDGEEFLLKFPANLEFAVKKENGKIKVNRERLTQKLEANLKDFPLSHVLELAV